nr:hypothetical protein [Tanacetum cinerariifolium]
MNFLESYGYMDPMLILIQIPYLLHLEGKLFESRGCLLHVFRDDIGSSKFTIYEMMKRCFICIVFGDSEEDSLLVINLSRKVVQYNLISKTLHDIYDCGSNQLDDNHDDDADELLQQFEAEHNVYEFSILQVESELQVSSKLDLKVSSERYLEKGYDQSFHQRLVPKVLDELIEITDSTELHKRMRARRRVLIGEMEALRDPGVAVDSSDSLKQTQARGTTKLAAFTKVLAETKDGIHEKEGHMAKMDLND